MKNFNDVISGAEEVINNAKQGNFDEVLAKTRNYAEKATKRSAERLEISKKKIELLDSKTKLTRAYEKYGKLMYKKNQGESIDEEELKSCEASISLQQMRSDMLDEEIKELRAVFAEASVKRETKKTQTQSEEAQLDVAVVEPSENDG